MKELERRIAKLEEAAHRRRRENTSEWIRRLPRRDLLAMLADSLEGAAPGNPAVAEARVSLAAGDLDGASAILLRACR